MLRKFIWIALASGLAAKLYRDIRNADLRAASLPESEPLHTWEDAGGALHPASH